MPARKKTTKIRETTAQLGFEAKLWLAADKLRSNMDAAEPKRSGDSQPKAARRASETRQYRHRLGELIDLIGTTRRLAIMNLTLRGIEADFGPEHADTFRRDLHLFHSPTLFLKAA
jgi:type I restriction-modification system DNA methylase subunit